MWLLDIDERVDGVIEDTMLFINAMKFSTSHLSHLLAGQRLQLIKLQVPRTASLRIQESLL